MIPAPILDAALAAYAATPGTSRVAMKAALEAVFAMHPELITEEWLRSVGFKWHEFERSGGKHWLLWLGEVCADEGHGYDTQDLGIEVAPWRDRDGECWFCWLRSDCAHRYHRFIHTRHLRTRGELIRMIEGLTGVGWNPENHFYGAIVRERRAQKLREEHGRLDLVLMREGNAWLKIEDDESRGGALPEHLQAAIDAGKAK